MGIVFVCNHELFLSVFHLAADISDSNFLPLRKYAIRDFLLKKYPNPEYKCRGLAHALPLPVQGICSISHKY